MAAHVVGATQECPSLRDGEADAAIQEYPSLRDGEADVAIQMV
jgi:hypothetical protein